MLIKYLNDLDRAVQKAQSQPGLEQFGRCVDCVVTLERYLDDQMEPLKRKGFEIMEQLLPAEYEAWLAELTSSRLRQAPSQLAGSL